MPRTDVLTDWTEPVSEAYGQGRSLLLLFDYDGTLTPIVRHPSLALLPPSTRDLLTAFAALPRVAVGVVSGRALDEVKRLVPLHGCYYAGSGGLEMDLLGECFRYPLGAAFEDTLSIIQENLNDLLHDHPGTWVEHKPLSLAIHFRELLPPAAVRFQTAVTERLAAVPQVRFQVVSEAFEVTPAGGWDKGTAVEAILNRMRGLHAEPPLPVFFGDSPNDAEAMTASRHADGFAIGVGSDAPQVAMHWLPDSVVLAGQLQILYRRLAIVGDGLRTPETPEVEMCQLGRTRVSVPHSVSHPVPRVITP